MKAYINKIKENGIKFFKDPWNIVLITVLFFSFLSRWKYLFIDSIWNDASVYLFYGLEFIKNPLIMFNKHFLTEAPLWQIILGMFSIFFKPFIAGRIAALIISLFGIVMIYLIGKEMKNKAVGLTAAILLGFNHLYWFLSGKALADVPVTVAIIFVSYCLIKFEKKQTIFWAILLTISTIFAPLVKKTAALSMIFVVPLYFVITRKKELLKDKLAWVALSLPIFMLTIGNFISYYLMGDFYINQFIYKITTLAGLDTTSNYTKTLITFILNPYLAILLVIGIIFLLFYKKKERIYLLLWFFVYYLFIEVAMDRAPVPRYLLPMLPAAILIISIGLNEIRLIVQSIVKIKVSKWTIVIIALLLIIPFYKLGTTLYESKQYSFSGYQKAGAWLKQNTKEDSIIYTTAPRQIRSFTQRDFIRDNYNVNYGGTISYITNFTTFDAFIKDTIKFYVPVYLHLDLWESGQPKWSHINQENIKRLQNSGFQIVYIIEGNIPTNKGLQKGPVGIILKKT